MIKVRFNNFLIYLFGLGAVLSFAYLGLAKISFADDSKQVATSTQSIKWGLIYQFAGIDFKPRSLFLIYENNLGSLHRVPAAYLPLKDEVKDPLQRAGVILGAKVAIDEVSNLDSGFKFTFLFRDSSGRYRSSQIDTWNKETLINPRNSKSALQSSIESMGREYKIEKKDLDDLQEKLASTRESAIKIAGIDEIISLRSELSVLEDYINDKKGERERLKVLLEIARVQQESVELDARRQLLSQQLKETAVVTSMTDRLNARRKQAALVSFQHKISLVREMENVDAGSLAQEALRLRAKRKQLESQLKIKPEVVNNEF